MVTANNGEASPPILRP